MSQSKQKWFFLVNNEVQGPFPEAELKSLAQKNPSGLVWGQGLSEWMKPVDWERTLSHLNEVLTSLQTDMTPQWRLKQGDFEAGPFTYDQLLQVLKAHPSPSEVSILQDGDGTWKDIYQFPIIVEEVGITRRSHARVPISGIFRFEKNGTKQDSLLSSISEGGIGILEATGISIGDHVKGIIQSPQLPTPINCNCEVMYKQNDGSWGLKFHNLPMEFQSLIVEYSQKFQK